MGNFTPPEDSENYQKLLDYVRDHPKGGDDFAGRLRSLLWLLNVPGHLELFGWITIKIGRLLEHQTELKSLFDEYRATQPKTWNEGFINDLKDWVLWYQVHKESVDQWMGECFSSGPESQSHPLQRRGMSRYSLYAALLCLQVDGTAKKQWEILALRLILSHQYRMRAWPLADYESYGGKSESPKLPVKLYSPSKQLRYLTESYYSSLLSDLNAKEVVGAGGFLDEIDGNADQDNETDVSTEQLKGLLSFMYMSEAGEQGRKRTGSRRKNLKRDHQLGHGYVEIDERVSLHLVEIDIDDPWSDDLPLTAIEIFEEDEDLSAKDMADMDLHPSELADGSRLSLADQECNSSEKTTFSSVLAARARNKHLAIQAQLFPWRYSSLSIYQLKYIDESLREKIQELSQNDSRSEDDEMSYQSSLILLTMLWTGSNLDRALDLSVHNQIINDGETKLGFYDHGELYEGVRYEWRFKALAPEYLSRPIYGNHLFRQRNNSFWLPDITGVASHLSCYRQQQKEKKFRSFLGSHQNSIFDTLRS